MLRTKTKDPETIDKDKWVWFFEVEHSGNFQFKPFYQLVHRWYKYNGWVHWQGVDAAKPEDLYWVHEQMDGSTDLLCFWRFIKPINKFIRYFGKIDFQVLGIKSKEIMYNGKKVKTESSNITMRLWWWVQLDPDDKWEKSRFKFLKKSFYKYLYKDEVDTHKERLKVESMRLMDLMKAYFKMPALEQNSRTFFPEYGFEWDKTDINPKDFEHIDRKPDPDI